jgi:hypothetical protein
MYRNKHMGTIACLISAPRLGLRSLDETRGAAGAAAT